MAGRVVQHREGEPGAGVAHVQQAGAVQVLQVVAVVRQPHPVHVLVGEETAHPPPGVVGVAAQQRSVGEVAGVLRAGGNSGGHRPHRVARGVVVEVEGEQATGVIQIDHRKGQVPAAREVEHADPVVLHHRHPLPR